MEKSKKLKGKVIAAIVAILLLGGGITVFSVFDPFNLISFSSSGTFTNRTANISNRDGNWNFSAQRANGNATFNTNLDAEGIANFTLQSSLGSGNMRLTLTQGDLTRTFNLNQPSITMTSQNLDLNVFEAGRIRMRLYFDNAQSISVNASW